MSFAAISPEQAAAIVGRAQHDPLFLPDHLLGVQLWAKQQEIIQSVWQHPRTSVRSCHGTGKTFNAATVGTSYLLAHPDSIVITTAPTFRQVKNAIWREMRGQYGRAKYPIGGELAQTQLDLGPNWYAIGLSTNHPDNFQGFHAPHILVIVDEAAGVGDPIFEAIDSVLSSAHARLLMIGNPTSLSGRFYDSFSRLKGYNRISISCFDTPNFIAAGITSLEQLTEEAVERSKSLIVNPALITPAWVFDKLQNYGADSQYFQARALGEFPRAGSSDSLIPLQDIENAIGRGMELEDARAQRQQAPESRGGVIGIDVSRYGDDRSVLKHRIGKEVVRTEKIMRSDTMELVGHVVNFVRGTWADVNIDVIGVGAGVYDRLNEIGVKTLKIKSLNGVNVGMPAIDPERYLNVRAEMYDLTREWLRDGGAIPNDDDLRGQLASIRKKYTSRGQLQIESKEDMRKRGMKSPDEADALALTFVAPPPEEEGSDFFTL